MNEKMRSSGGGENPYLCAQISHSARRMRGYQVRRIRRIEICKRSHFRLLFMADWKDLKLD